MILIAGSSADSDGADNLPTFFQRNTTGEDHYLAAVRRVDAKELIT